MIKLRRLLYTTGLTLALASCASDRESAKFYSNFHETAPLKSVSSNKNVDVAVVAAVDLLKQGEYKKASRIINTRLQENPTHLAMHILNGITYEKLAEVGGESAQLDLAIVGYETALNLDFNSLLAMQRLAQLRFKKKDFDKAQELYANALLLKPDDPVLLQELAAASYYAYDLKTAQITIERAVQLKPDSLLAQRSAAMIHAALGDFDASDKYFNKYKALIGQDPDVKLVSGRLDDWKNLYNSGRIHLAQSDEFPPFDPDADSNGTGEPDVASLSDQVLDVPFNGSDGSGNGDLSARNQGGSGQSSSISAKTNRKSSKQQIIIDCYLLRIRESAETSKGNNILETLQVTLSPGGYYFGRTKATGSGLFTRNQAAANSTPASNSAQLNPNFVASNTGFGAASAVLNVATKGSMNFTSFLGGLNWSGLSYNLNIANVADSRTEVIARPSLLTYLNHESVFFSGTELVVGLVGNEGGNLVKYPVGVTLVVTPTELDMLTGDISLDISVEGAEFDAPDAVQDLQSTVKVGKTRVDTKAKLKLGQTLALGGIYERVEMFKKKGFPGLSDVPIVQYFFSNELTGTTRRSVVILMTPRSPEKTIEDVARALAEDRMRPNLDELERRHSDWFQTSPNLAKIFTYLDYDPIIYKEFRSVDVLPPSWGEPDSLFNDGWAMLASYLYY